MIGNTVLVEASRMRESKFGSQLLDLLLDFKQLVHNGKINFKTNIKLQHPHSLMNVFSTYLRHLSSSGTERVIISL